MSIAQSFFSADTSRGTASDDAKAVDWTFHISESMNSLPHEEKNVEAVARSLISLIEQSLENVSETFSDHSPKPVVSAASEIPRGKRRFVPAEKMCRSQNFHIYLLPYPATVTPKADESLRYSEAGLGLRVITLPSDASHDQISQILILEYPMLQSLNGSWMFYKASGGGGRRKLTAVSPQAEGYTTSDLKRASNGGKIALYIAPIHGQLDVTPVARNASEFSKLSKVTCEICRESMPSHLLSLHVVSCEVQQSEELDVECVSATSTNKMVPCPICNQLYASKILEAHASFCGESSAVSTSVGASEDWRTVTDPRRAVWLFTQELLKNNKKNSSEENRLVVDLRTGREHQDCCFMSFFKQNDVEWACPLTCALEGEVNRQVLSTLMLRLRTGFHFDVGHGPITKIFEGEVNHLVPSNSAVMVESELFLMAGRMLGHCFLLGGPGFPGLSPAIKHVLCGGSVETAPITTEDCLDLDIRRAIQLLTKTSELKEEERQTVASLCLSWDLPIPNETNIKWLQDKLLLHAVLSRSSEQVEQLQKGLKETGIWPLLCRREDVVKQFFPSETEAEITPQMILSQITWPTLSPDSDSDDEESIAAKTRICGYFQTFIEEASSEEMRNLLRFWAGLEVPPKNLIVKISSVHFPKASTYLETVTLPQHYVTYKELKSDLEAVIATHGDTGLV